MSYKLQGLNEGISENIIKVTGNPIVDIINENLKLFESSAQYLDDEVLDLSNDNFVLVTCHRRENILNKDSFKNIISLLNSIDDRNVIFPMGIQNSRNT